MGGCNFLGEPPETTPFTYNNPAFEGSSLDMSSNVMAKIQHKRRTRSFQVPSPISKLDGQVRFSDTMPFNNDNSLLDSSSNGIETDAMTDRKIRSFTIASPVSFNMEEVKASI